jgi:hypothetical protein
VQALLQNLQGVGGNIGFHRPNNLGQTSVMFHTP